MKLLILFILLFSAQAQSAKQKLNTIEIRAINSFSTKVNKALIAADSCLTELEVNKRQGLKCDDYNQKTLALNKAYRPVMKIKPDKRRHEAIAENDDWYHAFRDFDRLMLLVKRINEYIL